MTLDFEYRQNPAGSCGGNVQGAGEGGDPRTFALFLATRREDSDLAVHAGGSRTAKSTRRLRTIRLLGPRMPAGGQWKHRPTCNERFSKELKMRAFITMRSHRGGDE